MSTVPDYASLHPGYDIQLLRQGEHRAWRCDAAEWMRAERDQRRVGLGRERARHQHRPAERPAQSFEPAHEIDGGTDRGEVEPIGGADIAPEHLAEMQRRAERAAAASPCVLRSALRCAMPARAADTARSAASQAPRGTPPDTGKIARMPSPMNFSTSPPKA